MISFPVTIALFVSLVAGGWLLMTARRAGPDLAEHCLECGYNLTGLTNDRCPECGTTLSEETRLTGEPSSMHWDRFIAGMALVGVPLMYALARAFGWA